MQALHSQQAREVQANTKRKEQRVIGTRCLRGKQKSDAECKVEQEEDDVEKKTQLRHPRERKDLDCEMEEMRSQLVAERDRERKQREAAEAEIARLKEQLARSQVNQTAALLQLYDGADRQTLVKEFSNHEPSKVCLKEQSPATNDAPLHNLYIFLDDSNVWITAKKVWEENLALGPGRNTPAQKSDSSHN